MNSTFDFFIGLALLIIFIWYFATESVRRKRIIGSVLAVGVTALALLFFRQIGIEKGIELRGGISAILQIQPGEDRQVSDSAQDHVIGVLQKRLNAQGTKEIILVPQGRDRIFMQFPGITSEEAEKVLNDATKNAKLEFSLVHEQNRTLAPLVAAEEEVVPGWHVLPGKPDDKAPEGSPVPQYLVEVRPDMSGEHVTSARVSYDNAGQRVVLVDFDSEGSSQFGELSKNYGRQLAIILDGEVISAPGFNSGKPIYGTCEISGDFSEREVLALASALQNPLSNELKILSVNQISPTLGKDTVNQGLLAGISGLAITLIFMLLYYRVGGILSVLGLIINLAVIFGAMSLFKFTLTLPGIAGIILTIGMSIDANVLIFERLREERAAGKSLANAIDAAYDKALSAILDANLTTLITSIILYVVATGTIKGFAITLTIGIIASLFSALLVTRVCFSWIMAAKFLKGLNFMNLIPERNINFLKGHRMHIIISAALVVMSLIVTPLRDPRGVELKGGDLITIKTHAENVTTASIKESLKDASIQSHPIVQEQSPAGQPDTFYIIRGESGSGDAIKAELQKDLGINLDDTETEQVGSQVGGEMLKTSTLALGIGLLAIMIYVTIRFEFAFALGALAALIHDLIIVVGFLSLFGRDISLITVGALLTIAGYSINDTIVVFDRVREGLRSKRGEVADVMNYCINATLSRTMLTSITTLITAVTLFLFGGPALSNFSVTIIIGILVGTYSSIFVASPIVLWWAKRTKTNLRREILDADQAKVAPPSVQSPS